MTVTTFPNLNSMKACSMHLRAKASHARPPFRQRPFRLRLRAAMCSVLRQPVREDCSLFAACVAASARLPTQKSGPPRILILTPTRELAMQVADHARELAANTHLDIATITGGVAYMNHAEVFSENRDIVVATTGRLLQYIKEENFDCRAVETLILDEADRMLDMGFAQDIEHIAGETRWRNQTMLFSATLEGKRLKTSQSVCWKIR